MIKMRNQKGFTLVELLVVVVIIGILASVAIPNFVGAQDKAKNSAVQSNVHTVQMAVEQYGVDNGGAFKQDLYTNIIATGSYIAGNAFPRTPWNQAVQPATIAAAQAEVDAPINGDFTAGNSTTAIDNKNDYGAVLWLIGGTANEQYNLVGSGKRGGNAVKVVGVKNY